jgi:hypothetical protein
VSFGEAASLGAGPASLVEAVSPGAGPASLGEAASLPPLSVDVAVSLRAAVSVLPLDFLFLSVTQLPMIKLKRTQRWLNWLGFISFPACSMF